MIPLNRNWKELIDADIMTMPSKNALSDCAIDNYDNTRRDKSQKREILFPIETFGNNNKINFAIIQAHFKE